VKLSFIRTAKIIQIEYLVKVKVSYIFRSIKKLWAIKYLEVLKLGSLRNTSVLTTVTQSEIKLQLLIQFNRHFLVIQS